jgi:DNA ligase-1
MDKLKVKAMLAYKVGKKDVSQEDWESGVYIQPKLDGVRCIFQKDGAYSRNGKRWMNIKHIEEKLVGFFREYPNLVLDGELYNHKFCNDFEKIISLVRKSKPSDEDRQEAAELVQFHIYDVITPSGGVDKPIVLGENSNANYARRMAFIKSNFGRHKAPDCFRTLHFSLVNSYDEALAVHKANLKIGYEGSILRLNKRYEQKRSYTLQKFKDFHDAEATIIDYVEGKGKREGHLGKFLMQDFKGVKFGCPPGKGYNYADLKQMLKDAPSYIGKIATFTFFERTKAGSYRHPMFKTIRDYE